ncbi:MAG: hypothetical protein ACLR23_01025 [Clostridia bacterium]
MAPAHRGRYSDGRRPQNNSAQIELFTAALNQAEDDLATLQKQVDSLYDLLEQGIYTKEVFLQRSKVLSEKLADKKKSGPSTPENWRKNSSKKRSIKTLSLQSSML